MAVSKLQAQWARAALRHAVLGGKMASACRDHLEEAENHALDNDVSALICLARKMMSEQCRFGLDENAVKHWRHLRARIDELSMRARIDKVMLS